MQLDAEARDYLGRVRRAVQRMGALIDDLLELSRVGRMEMQVMDVVLSAVAHDNMEHLRASEPGRAAKVTIASGLRGRGDERLVRLLLQNLLDNAWKYRRRTAEAHIEFGVDAGSTPTSYYVRDNGAGFDMQYVNKLFQPFQRLHRAEDYGGGWCRAGDCGAYHSPSRRSDVGGGGGGEGDNVSLHVGGFGEAFGVSTGNATRRNDMARGQWIWLRWIGAVLALVSTAASADLVLGVHPFKPATQLTEAFTPLTNYLSDKMGEPVSLRIAPDYEAHIDSAGRDEVDIAYMGPVSYVKLVEKYGPRRLLARQAIGGNPVFHAKIFVRADSPIHTLADLRGKRFAFGEPNSTMSHLVPRYMLWQAGVAVEQLASTRFVGDHENVALGVLAGNYDAGAVKEDVYFSYESRGLRAIATSAPVSDHVFIAARRLSDAKVRKLREILLHADRDPQGAAALGAMTPGVKALVPVKDGDYDPLRVVLKKMQELGVKY